VCLTIGARKITSRANHRQVRCEVKNIRCGTIEANFKAGRNQGPVVTGLRAGTEWREGIRQLGWARKLGGGWQNTGVTGVVWAKRTNYDSFYLEGILEPRQKGSRSPPAPAETRMRAQKT